MDPLCRKLAKQPFPSLSCIQQSLQVPPNTISKMHSFLRKVTIANFDSSTASNRSEICFPLSSRTSSLKVKMPFCFKAKYRWLTKLFRLSWPLKLRKTPYFHVAVEGHDDQSFWVLMKAAENIPVNLETQNRFFFIKVLSIKTEEKKINGKIN